jgi:hypothetical protein
MYTCETRLLECVADFNKVVGQKKKGNKNGEDKRKSGRLGAYRACYVVHRVLCKGYPGPKQRSLARSVNSRYVVNFVCEEASLMKVVILGKGRGIFVKWSIVNLER